MTSFLARLRLRPKLAALLSIAALVPASVVSWLALGVVLRNLDRGVNEDTARQLEIGLGLVLRHVERLGADAIRLARGGELSAAMATPEPFRPIAPPAPAPAATPAAPPPRPGSSPAVEFLAPVRDVRRELAGVLDRVSPYLAPALVQVFDDQGQGLASAVVGHMAASRAALAVAPDSAPVTQALAYDSPLTMTPVGDTLVVRAAAPIVDPSYRLLGAVVISSPLDGPFIDEVKSTLGIDVLLFSAARPLGGPDTIAPRGPLDGSPPADAAAPHHAVSTLFGETGERHIDIALAPDIALRARAHQAILEARELYGHPYVIGYTGLVDLDRRQVGVLAVAVDRAPLADAKAVATRTLIVGAGGAFLFALLLAGFLTRRLTRPIARLHRAAVAVAAGDLDQRIESTEHDEIGDLATAFSHMTATLSENRRHLAASAADNARLYEEVRAFNEELEAMVAARTAELTRANSELGRALAELGETQAQLILSERMAGLGLLVAGVAHEINSPSAAIAGSVDALVDHAGRLRDQAHRLAGLELAPAARADFSALVTRHAPALAALPLPSAVTVRRAARALAATLGETLAKASQPGDAPRGEPTRSATTAARRLAEIGADEELAAALAGHAMALPVAAREPAIELFAENLFTSVLLHRNALTIRSSIQRIQSIVRALKNYSHLDEQAGLLDTDLHEGIENTLIILHHELRDITVQRRYGELPNVPAYVDELNQVWTNLIHNAVQALEGHGTITIETCVVTGGAAIRIIDDGPGIAGDIIPRIFEPFFTTKPKGEGTGLGLGIVRQIVAKHRGRVGCDSRPGRTCFEVWLPLASEPDARGSADGDAAGGAT